MNWALLISCINTVLFVCICVFVVLVYISQKPQLITQHVRWQEQKTRLDDQTAAIMTHLEQKMLIVTRHLEQLEQKTESKHAFFLFDTNTGVKDIQLHIPSMLKYASELLRVFHEYKVPYYIANGTLLGLIRDKQLLAHDHDFDVNISVYDYYYMQNTILPVLFRLNFHLVQMIPAHPDESFFTAEKFPCPYTLKRFLFIKNQQMFDIAMHIWFPPTTLHSVKGIPFPVSIPEKPEIYLQDLYGESWRTPITSWTLGQNSSDDPEKRGFMSRPWKGDLYYNSVYPNAVEST